MRDFATKKSTGGTRIQLIGVLVACLPFKPRYVAASIIGVGYVSLAKWIQKVRYLQHILQELGPLYRPTIIYGENQARISRATKHGKRNKHADVRYHVYWKSDMTAEIKEKYSPTTKWRANMWTKQFGLQVLSQFRELKPSMASQPSTDNSWEWSVCRGRVLEGVHNTIPFSHDDTSSLGILVPKAGSARKCTLFRPVQPQWPKRKSGPLRFCRHGPWIWQRVFNKNHKDQIYHSKLCRDRSWIRHGASSKCHEYEIRTSRFRGNGPWLRKYPLREDYEQKIRPLPIFANWVHE